MFCISGSDTPKCGNHEGAPAKERPDNFQPGKCGALSEKAQRESGERYKGDDPSPDRERTVKQVEGLSDAARNFRAFDAMAVYVLPQGRLVSGEAG